MSKSLYASIVSLFLCSIAIAVPPSQPQNLQQAWLGTESLLLWDEAPNARSYNIYRSDNTNTTWALVGSSSVPRFRDATYQFLPSFYVVTSVNSDGESSGSEPSTVSFAEQFLITVYEPHGWDGTLSPTNAIVQWATSDPNGAQGIVDWGLDSTNYTSFAINTNYLAYQNFNLTNLAPLTVYYYRLTSINSNRSGVVYLGYFGTPDTNHPPVAEDYNAWWPSFTNGMWVPLRGRDSNFPPATLTYRIVSQPTNGSLSGINPAGTWNEAYVIYTPALGARGYDYFRYVVNNGTWDSAPALVTLTNWVNTPPATTNAQLTTVEDTPLEITLPVFDMDGDPVTFDMFGVVWGGSVTGTPPNITFIPSTNFNGMAWFSYRVLDAYSDAYGWVQIDVTPVNDPPVILTNIFPPVSTWEDQSVSFWLAIYDVEGLYSYELIQVVPPAHGTLSGEVWNLIYTPETNFFGTETFTIAVREINGPTSDPVTFSIEVRPSNDAPIAFDQNVTGFEDTPLVIVPTGFDIEGDSLTFQVVQYPWSGWVEQTGTNFIYHPTTNFIGQDTFSFRAVDSMGFWSWVPAWIHIQIVDANDAPVASYTHHDLHTDIIVARPFNVTDLDGNTLFCEIVQPPLQGTVTVSGTNFTYTPGPGLFDYEDSFTYRVSDGLVYGNEGLVTLWIAQTNSTPVAQDQSVSTRANEVIAFQLSIQDQDWVESPIGILETPPSNGTVQFTNYGVAYYTPAPGFVGTDSFTYRPYDGFATGNLATVTITVTPPNLPPVANNSSVTVNEDSSINFNFSATDPNGDGLTYELVVTPMNGVLMGFGPARNYQPVANFSGTDSITFRVFDGQFYSGNATVTITVNPVNDAPVASNSTATVNEDSSVSITMNGSDVDNNIASCTFTVITPPAHGTLGAGNRVRTYSPAHNYFGPDSFTFQINDGSLSGNIAIVSINVLPVSDPPVAQFQIITNYEDTSFPITLLGSDPDGDPLTFGLMSQPYFGSLTGTPPNLTYLPLLNWNSGSPTITNVDTFFFTVSDGSITKSSVVTIVLLPVNDRPVANNQSRTTAEDSPVNITLTGSDVDGDALTFAIVNNPVNGALSGSAPNLVYTPNTNFNGSDSFTFLASDGATSSVPATVSITVTPVNDPPVANAQSITTFEDTTANVPLTGSDPDGDTLSYSIVSGPSHGTLSGAAPNLVYTPATDYFGSDSFTFSVSDGIASSTATVSITVTPVNDLSAPDGLHRRIYGNDGIVRLWWNAVPGAQSYSVYRADTNSPFTLLASSITETNFNDTNALWQQTYWYRIATWDGTAEGAPSNPVLARRDDTGLITTYEENWLILGTTARVQFCSSLVSGTEGLWEYGTTTNYDRVLENTNLLGCHNFNLGPLIPQTTYYYRLTATDSNGNAVAYWNSFTTRGAPVADPQSASIAEDGTHDFILTGHISPGTGYAPPITYAIGSGPAHGTLTLLFGNMFRYSPAANYNGPDSFTFKVNDSDQDSAPATVSITVTPVNDPPIITVPTSSANWQITASTVTPQWSTDVPVNAQFRYGPISGPLWWVASPNYGTQHSLTVSGLVPDQDYVYGIAVWTTSGDTNWTSGGFHTATNHAPVASNQTVYANANVATNIYPTASDADAQTLNFTVVASPTNGSFISTGSNWFRYLPATNFVGVDGFAYRVDDGFATSQVAAVTIFVFAPNGAPIALPYSTNTLEDVAVAVPFRGVDAQSNTLSYLILAAPLHGTLTTTATNTTYRPETNYNGSDSFTYRAFDGANFSAPANVSLTVTPVNDRPIANNQSVTATEDVALPITLTGSDVDFNSLTYTIASGPAHGTLSGSGNSRTYTPATNYNGADSFTFFVNDGMTNSAAATVTITVTAVNDAPIALPQSLTLAEDTSVAFSVSGSDVDGDALSFEVVTSPTNGTLNVAGTNYTYRPATNFFGGDSFTFRAFDGTLWSAPATVSITVTSANDAPIAFPQSVTVGEDASRLITLTAYDGDGETLTYSIVSSPTHGALSGTLPNVTYQPDANYNGADSFTFQVTDGNTFSAPATVSITVSPVNDAPVVTNRTFAATEDTSLNFTLTGSDVEGDALTFRITSTPLHGTVTGIGPSFTYTPDANYAGTDSFYYTANDGTWDGNIAAVIITIASVNDVPSATNQNITTMEDTSVTFTPLAGDIEGDALTFTIFTAPTNGIAVVSGGNLIYTPNANYNGTDSFEYQAHDSNGGDTMATVLVTVQSVNDAPVASNGSRTLAEDTSAALTLTASDVDGDALTFSIVTAPLHGTLSGTGANFTYTPTANYNGADLFTYRATDPSGASSDALYSPTITPVNDRPVGTDQTVGVVEETPLWFVPTAMDVDSDSIGFVITQPVHGTAVVTNGGILYTPETNYFGNDILYYWPTDAISTGALTVVVFNITNVNDAPTANSRTATTAEDTGVNIALSGSDPDNDALTFTIISAPAHGTMSGTGASRTYTPAANYNGSDSFTFLVNDGTTDSVAATVSITVTPVNDAPSIMGYAAVTDEDTPITFTITASDVDNDPLTYIVVSNPSHGTLSGTGPTFTYTPSLNYTGSDSITFKVSDGTVNSGNANASFTVRAVNDAPTANAQSVSVNEDTSVAITLTGSDVDGDTLSYTRLSNPAHGTVSGTPLNITSTNANFTYTPAANYNGPDSFTFKVNDGRTNSTVATVTINVVAVNDAPVANAQSVSVTYNTAQSITLTGSDLEGSALTYSIVNGPTNGTLSGTAPNITYTPTVGSAGADFFTFRVNDGSSNSAAATVSITTQNPVGIPPAPTSLAVTVPTANGTLILNWSCTATNEDGFKIERSLNGSSGWSQVATTEINIHTYTNTGLTSNTRYYYRVRSYNRLGNSAYSNTVNAKAR